jgi:pyridoxal phosphate enzyme (YggS family)
MSVKENTVAILRNIEEARRKGEFAAKKVLLLAVSKTKTPDMISRALEAGVTDFGENRVQELGEKYILFPEINWHLIGSLQSNKVKHLFNEGKSKVRLIHSLDRLELAAEIEKRAAKAGTTVPALIQVNIAEEKSKSGIKREEAADFASAVKDLPHLRICGLMTIGPLVANPEEIRPVFRELRRLAFNLNTLSIPGVSMRELSMGMSQDYQVAVEEGATIVRVGSALFGER